MGIIRKNEGGPEAVFITQHHIRQLQRNLVGIPGKWLTSLMLFPACLMTPTASSTFLGVLPLIVTSLSFSRTPKRAAWPRSRTPRFDKLGRSFKGLVKFSLCKFCEGIATALACTTKWQMTVAFLRQQTNNRRELCVTFCGYNKLIILFLIVIM